MVLFNYSTKELTAKVVYYGPGLCGKTTNLQWIHEKLPIKNKGKMLSLATETDRTLFFDFLPIEIGTIRGMRTRIQLYTVPGQVFYNATRRMVLKGADCVVFVCDSQEAMLDANLESFENLRQNLEANDIDADEIPVVLQYNKRDLPNALPIEILNERLNPANHPFHEAVAVKGTGVEDTLKGVTRLLFKSLSARYGDSAAPGTNPKAVPPASNPPTPAPKAAARAPAPRAAAPPRPARPAGGPPAPSPARGSAEELLGGLGGGHDPVLEEVVDEESSGFTKTDPKGTMISNRFDAEDLRRRIAAPAPAAQEFEVDLEEIEEEEEEIDELSIEAEPPPRPDPVVSPSTAPRTARSAPAPAPPAPAARTPRPPAGPTASMPVEVRLDVTPGQAEVQVPIELELEPGTTRITLNLRLSLNFKRSR